MCWYQYSSASEKFSVKLHECILWFQNFKLVLFMVIPITSMSLWNLLCRLEAWIPALDTLQEGVPITTMPISTALMQGGWKYFKSLEYEEISKHFKSIEISTTTKTSQDFKILHKWMSRSATGAVDPDICKMIGDG